MIEGLTTEDPSAGGQRPLSTPSRFQLFINCLLCAREFTRVVHPSPRISYIIQTRIEWAGAIALVATLSQRTDYDAGKRHRAGGGGGRRRRERDRRREAIDPAQITDL